MEFPPYSPDMAVMDYYVCPRVEAAVKSHPRATNRQELRQKIVAAWDDLDEAEIRRAVMGLKRRAQGVCPQVRGGVGQVW